MENLPTEIVVHLFSYLSVKDKLSCRLSCSFFRAILDIEPIVIQKYGKNVIKKMYEKREKDVLILLNEKYGIIDKNIEKVIEYEISYRSYLLIIYLKNRERITEKYYIKTIKKSAVRKMIKHNRLGVLKFLNNYCSLSKTQNEKGLKGFITFNDLRLCCSHKRNKMVRYIFEHGLYDLEDEENRDKTPELMFSYIFSNPPDMKVLLGYMETASNFREICSSMLNAYCLNNNLDMFSYIAEKYGITYVEITADSNFIIRAAAEYGYLDIIKYVVNRYILSSEDIKDYDNAALKSSVDSEHFPVVKYICENFAITREDIEDNDYQILGSSTLGESAEIFEYICEKFEIKYSELVPEDEDADMLSEVIVCESIEVFRSIVKRYGILAADIRRNNYYFLTSSMTINSGDPEMFGYLSKTCGLSLEEIRSIKLELVDGTSNILGLAVSLDTPDIFFYIAENFKLEKEDITKRILSSCSNLEILEYLVDFLDQ